MKKRGGIRISWLKKERGRNKRQKENMDRKCDRETEKDGEIKRNAERERER